MFLFDWQHKNEDGHVSPCRWISVSVLPRLLKADQTVDAFSLCLCKRTSLNCHRTPDGTLPHRQLWDEPRKRICHWIRTSGEFSSFCKTVITLSQLSSTNLPITGSYIFPVSCKLHIFFRLFANFYYTTNRGRGQELGMENLFHVGGTQFLVSAVTSLP